jgi:hypothetical protein
MLHAKNGTTILLIRFTKKAPTVSPFILSSNKAPLLMKKSGTPQRAKLLKSAENHHVNRPDAS